MEKTTITKEQAIKAIAKLVDTKKTVQAYMRGEVTIEMLAKKGIKLATPL